VLNIVAIIREFLCISHAVGHKRW